MDAGRKEGAEIAWRGPVPVSTRFDDPYYSLEDGLAESRHVFLAGNWLPERFRPGFHVAELGFGIADLAWVDRGGTPVLLMAGARGLYEQVLSPGAVPVQNLVDPAQPDRGFYAVDTFIDVRGRTGVVVVGEASSLRE